MHTVENPGEGVPDVFVKIPGGDQGFQEILPGGPPILDFIAFLLTSVLKFSWGGSYIYHPPSYSTPPHVHL